MPPKLVRLGDLTTVLRRHEHSPVHRRGQNFLVDGNVLEKIVAAALLSPDDTVLEIGAGAGALTQALADLTRRVVAVEIDRRLGDILRQLFRDRDNIEIVVGDALRLPWSDLVSPEKTIVVANLPYCLTTPLWTRLVESGFPRQVLMVQKEVAERAVANPAEPAYGAFTLFLAYHGRVEVVAKVPPTAFFPQPAVHSCIVRFTRHSSPLVTADHALWQAVVRIAFRYRRKTLRRALAEGFALPAHALAVHLRAVGLDPERRGETLSVQEFAAACRAVAAVRQAPDSADSVPEVER